MSIQEEAVTADLLKMSETWLIIKFADNSVAVIPDFWLSKNKQKTYLPPYRTDTQNTKAARKRQNPQKNWRMYDVSRILLDKNTTYEAAAEKLPVAFNESDVDREFSQQTKESRSMGRKKVQESDFIEDEETTDGEKGVLTYQDFPTALLNDQLPPTKASADKEAEGDPKEISITAGLTEKINVYIHCHCKLTHILTKYYFTEITATICKPISNTFVALQNEISVDADKDLLAVEKQDNVTGKDRGYCEQLNDSNSQDSMEIASEEDLYSSEKVSNIFQSAGNEYCRILTDSMMPIYCPSLSNKEPSGYCEQLNDSNSQDSMEIESEENLYSSEKVSNIFQSAGNKKLSSTTTFMWYIVKLAQKPEAAVVPGFWLNFDRKECAWPQTNTEYVIQNNIVNRLKSLKNWVTRGVIDILEFADSFDEAVMKQQRAWGKENRGIKRTAGQTNLNDDAPKIVTEEHVNLDVDPSNAKNFWKPRPFQRLALTEIKNLKGEDKIVYVAGNVYNRNIQKSNEKYQCNLHLYLLIFLPEMLHEVLRNQAEERLQNERRQVMIPTSSNGWICCSESSAIRSRFPIDSLKDFIKFNDDLRDGNYVIQVTK
ncbi:hypothetical protein TSAR_006393 [Trichomalopsis sarcophagae]|uniref:Uncharacterized protein n=1 Tax=Trichomalopsis sarcophagae TaxID=543379 RepID=A0A232EJ00_9HYME|nr:hypothetical protein TSAR_006393 [Trichomalopsis sarcophagae]